MLPAQRWSVYGVLMKINRLAISALLLPLTAHSADITLSEINARLEKLEQELHQSRTQLANAEQKIAIAEKRALAAENNVAKIQAVQQSDIALSKTPAFSKETPSGERTELKFGGYARTGILTGKQGTTSTVGPSMTPAGSTGEVSGDWVMRRIPTSLRISVIYTSMKMIPNYVTT